MTRLLVGTMVSGVFDNHLDKMNLAYSSNRDIWAQNTSVNPDVKIFVGAPASSTAAGTGYQTPEALADYAVTTRNSFPSFGGVMMWDASQAYRESHMRWCPVRV